MRRAIQPSCSDCAKWCFRAQRLKAELYGKEKLCPRPRTVLSPPWCRIHGRCQLCPGLAVLCSSGAQNCAKLGGCKDATFPPLLCLARVWGTKAGAGGGWMLLPWGDGSCLHSSWLRLKGEGFFYFSCGSSLNRRETKLSFAPECLFLPGRILICFTLCSFAV